MARHVPELDGVRGLAIAAVMALHFVYALEPQSLAERVAHKISGYGLWGVDLFFVLSGFLITGILHDAKHAPRYLSNFYIRRTLRIFPLYYAVLFVLLIALPAGWVRAFDPALLDARGVQGWLWPYLTNFYVARVDAFSIPYLSHFWSLAIEEHFYLFWPFVVGFLSRRRAMAACLMLGAVALSSRLWLTLHGSSNIPPQVLTPCRLDTLCLGAFFALGIRGPAGFAAWGTKARFWLAGSAAGLLMLSILHLAAPEWDTIVIEVRATVLALFCASMITCAADEHGFGILKAAFRARWLRTLGKYSYGLYVYHGLVAFAFERKRFFEWLERTLGSHGLATLVQVVAGVGLSLALAVASYEWFEVRFLSFKRLFEYGRKEAAPALALKADGQLAPEVVKAPPLAERGSP